MKLFTNQSELKYFHTGCKCVNLMDNQYSYLNVMDWSLSWELRFWDKPNTAFHGMVPFFSLILAWGLTSHLILPSCLSVLGRGNSYPRTDREKYNTFYSIVLHVWSVRYGSRKPFRFLELPKFHIILQWSHLLCLLSYVLTDMMHTQQCSLLGGTKSM